MKILSIKQPWASLIMFKGKNIENREWEAPAYLIGERIGIHSSKKREPEEWDDAIDLCYANGIPNFDITPIDFPLGCVLGTVRLAGCVTSHDSPWFVGTYGFVLEDPQPFATPVPMRGSLGFWDWSVPSSLEFQV